MAVGKRFKIKSDDDVNNIYKIIDIKRVRKYNHTSFLEVVNAFWSWKNAGAPGSGGYYQDLGNSWANFGTNYNRRYVFELELDHSLEDVKINNKAITHADNSGKEKSISFQFIEPRYNTTTKQKISDNPAMWETEPKKSADLDIYYEASEILPLTLDEKTNSSFIPLGSTVTCPARPNTIINGLTYVVAWNDNKITFNVSIDLDEYLPSGQGLVRLYFTRPDNSYTTLVIDVTATLADTTLGNSTYIIKRNVATNPFALSWFNCFSFGNGVESNRIRDDFNQPIIDKGVKVNTILEENYEEERRSSGLIYSGIYNTNSGINNLNQFIQAEKITKDLNPVYGSIQKLYSRSTADGDLIALCEDRIIKILANKDALFNADGNVNLTSTNNVLGQAIPYAGEFGISNNPESFAFDSYRAYFADKQRGAVLRLSMDGLTPISEYGMSDYFKDTISIANQLIGSFDDRKEEYNLTIHTYNASSPANKNVYTLSYSESAKGWISFKSWIKESGVSLSNDYYTFKNSKMHLHHANSTYNNFYSSQYKSTITPIFNDSSGTVKHFDTVSYEGTQSKVIKFTNEVVDGVTYNDGEYYNAVAKNGWYVESITTDLQEGHVNEFIDKENKWFNYIKGISTSHTNLADGDVTSNLDFNEINMQGIGELSANSTSDTEITVLLNVQLFCSLSFRNSIKI